MVGTSADTLLLVVLVRDDMGWVLCGGGGAENVSVLRSGSKGELDGEGDGVWTFRLVGTQASVSEGAGDDCNESV